MENILEDQTFIARFRAGDQAAFQRLYELLYNTLFFFAYNFVQRQDVAEDLVTENIVKLWQRKERMKTGKHIKAFLYLSIRNAALDHRRAEKRHAAAHKEIGYLADVSEGPMDQRVIEAEVLGQLFDQAGKLPQKCMDVFFLHFRGEMGIREVAALLGIAVSTARNHRANALKLLRALSR